MLAIPSRNKSYFARGLAIGAATALCAVLSMLLALAVLGVTESEGDFAKEQSLFEELSDSLVILSDPFVLLVALLQAFLTALIAYPFAFFLLVRTRLERSIPFVLLATLLGTALGAVSHIKLCFFFAGLVSGLAAMFWCNLRFRDATGPSS